MSIEFFTRLPLNGENFYPRGDSRNRGDWHNAAEGTGALANFRSGDSFSYMDYLAQVARAAEINQFAGALMVNAPNAEEPWLTCALLARETRNLQFVTAFQPFHFSPFAAAQMAATYQRATSNRLVWNIINGGSEQIQRQVGDTTAHDDRYLRASEFLDVVKGYWHSPQFHYQGDYYSAEGGGLSAQLRKAQLPLICTAGSSEAARELAAKHADYYLMRAEHPDEIRALIADVKARAQRHGRSGIRFGMSIDVISRPTEDEAQAEAKRFFDDGLAGAVEASKRFTGLVSARHLSYEKDFAHQADAKSFEQFFVYPNVWAGFGFIGIPPGCALVGSYANVVARIREYNALGIELFFLAGYPHLEEAYRLGEHILPHFRHERAPLVRVSEHAATVAEPAQEVLL